MRTRCWFIALAAALVPALVAVASPEATGSPVADEARARPGATVEPSPPFRVTVEAARAREQENALPLTTFYDPPAPWPQGPAGTLIRSEACNDYRFPSDLAPPDLGIAVIRFLYHSRSVASTDVPASGVILLPNGTPPALGWPVVVWAHGTSGVARGAAPSLMKDLYYGWEGLLQWPLLGYAVVAPDYAGLGTNGPHQYLAAPAQANDVLYAVPAARQAARQLGARWVAVGHSEGGLAVLKVAEMQAALKDPNYLGVVAIAPPGAWEASLGAINESMFRGYAAFVAFGLKAVYPDFEYADLLTPEATKLMPVVKEHGWEVSMATFAYQVPPGQMLRADWKQNRRLRQFVVLSVAGAKPTRGPVLLLAGSADETVPAKTVELTFQQLRRQGTAIEYRAYPGLDHDPLVFGSFRDQVRWVEDRFAGKPFAPGDHSPGTRR
jgi:alpha-beta hydrolase superfamily lysophospholipase